LFTDRASANGRFPNAQQLVVHPTNHDRLWLRATHGVLTSADRGKTWRWICEAALGYSGIADPAIAVTASGKVLVGLNGLSTSADDGCDWIRDQTFRGQRVADLSVEKSDPRRVIVLTSTRRDDGNYDNAIWRSLDAGDSWTKLPGALEEDLVGETLDAAPSDSRRLYVTGLVWSVGDAGPTNHGKIFVSKDDGATFESYDLPTPGFGYAPFLAAVHPTNPDVLYVRVKGPDITPPATGTVENFLLYSEDGGKTFREILHENADFLGFALSPDGSTVLLGMGDSEQPATRPVDKNALGLYSAQAPNHSFERLSSGHVGGLTFDGDELYLCTSQFAQGYEVMRSADRGHTLEGVTELANVEGPVICPCETSTGSLCPDQWPAMCEPGNLGRCSGPDDPKAKAYCGDPPAPPPPPEPPPDDGCGCRTPSHHTTIAAALSLLALASVPLLRRRRRR